MNFNLEEFSNKNIIFIGKGKEFKSFEKFISANILINSIESIYITDENREAENKRLESIDQHNTVIVKTAGYPNNLMPDVPYTTPTVVFFDCVKEIGAKTIAVTGTKGKTTTSSLIAFMLANGGYEVRLCGNIGNPMLDSLENAFSTTIFVIEISSFQLVELKQSPDVAVITNLFRDHVDFHGSLENYWEAKHNIVRYMDKNGTVVYNPDTEMVLHWLAENPAKKSPIDPHEQVDMSHSKLIGEHNALNYLMAQSVAEFFGIDKLTIKSSFRDFEPVKHRLQMVRKVKGVTFVDDAIGSNPDATIAGIIALIKNVGPVGCLFLGGVDRKYDFSELITLIGRIGIPKLVLFPDTGQIIKSQMPENYSPEILESTDMVEAVKWAAEKTPSGSICLLSTASPSTVLWDDFEAKGDLFQKAVNDLPS